MHQHSSTSNNPVDEQDESISWVDASENYDLADEKEGYKIPETDANGDELPQEGLTHNDRHTAHLHLLIPASKPNENLCKLLLSAAVLGYPPAVLVNWNQTFDTPHMVAGGSHIAKIRGVYEYLETLDKTHDRDLVLLMDAYDVWLQLGPQTLLNRYFNILRRENARVVAKYGPKLVQAHSLRQDVVFGAQKKCWPWTDKQPPCYAVPNSTLPEDVYGPFTDIYFKKSDLVPEPHVMYRQRFLNSGMSMGSVKGMRKLFGAALDIANLGKNSHWGSDQYILSEIYGHQQVWREILRRQDADGFESATPPVQFRQKDLDTVRDKASARTDQNYEFGIGLDYASELVLNTVFAENETAWIVASNESAVIAAEKEQRIDGPPRSILHNATALGFSIPTTSPPTWVQTAARWLSWSETRLLTHLWTGVSPVAIHHNAHRDHLKARRETWWPFLWMQPQLRDMLNAVISSVPARKLKPIGHGGAGRHEDREFWAWKDEGRAGARSASDGSWIELDEGLCARPAVDGDVDAIGGGVLDKNADTWEVIFGDGLGRWKAP